MHAGALSVLYELIQGQLGSTATRIMSPSAWHSRGGEASPQAKAIKRATRKACRCEMIVILRSSNEPSIVYANQVSFIAGSRFYQQRPNRATFFDEQKGRMGGRRHPARSRNDAPTAHSEAVKRP